MNAHVIREEKYKCKKFMGEIKIYNLTRLRTENLSFIDYCESISLSIKDYEY